MIENLKHAARNRQTVNIGGGEFSPSELMHYAKRLDLVDHLLHVLHVALPYIEDAEKDPVYKPGAVANVTAMIREVIKQGGSHV